MSAKLRNPAPDLARAEVPAREFKLEYLPTHRERYCLLCREQSLASPDVQRLLELLRSDQFRHAIDLLPGYQADAAGTVMRLEEMFPVLGQRRARRR